LKRHDQATQGRDIEVAIRVAEHVLRGGPQAGFGQSQRQNREGLRREQQGTLAEASGDLTLQGKYVADEGEHLIHREGRMAQYLQPTIPGLDP
jgi:hypothetical protein